MNHLLEQHVQPIAWAKDHGEWGHRPVGLRLYGRWEFADHPIKLRQTVAQLLLILQDGIDRRHGAHSLFVSPRETSFRILDFSAQRNLKLNHGPALKKRCLEHLPA